MTPELVFLCWSYLLSGERTKRQRSSPLFGSHFSEQEQT
jgi:hypothetical protein